MKGEESYCIGKWFLEGFKERLDGKKIVIMVYFNIVSVGNGWVLVEHQHTIKYSHGTVVIICYTLNLNEPKLSSS